jgi:lysophospholipase L1-like esterase
MPTEYVFGLDGESFVFYLRGSGSYTGIEVDGADDWSRLYTAPDGNFHFYTVQFNSRARRQITLKMGANYQFGGIYVPPAAGVWPGVLPKQIRMIVVGDSFSEDSASTGWSSGLMRLIQNVDVWASAVGSTGYVNQGTIGRTNFQARIFPDVITNSPDYVVFAGGINDIAGTTNAASSNLLYSTCLNIYQEVRSSLPACKIVVLGPFWPRTPPTDLSDPVYAVNGAISNACVDAGIGSNYIDTISDPWVTGVWNQPGSGNAVYYTSADGTHPTQEGHWNIAYHVASELTKRFPELQPRSAVR